jgi:hypothetical protein
VLQDRGGGDLREEQRRGEEEEGGVSRGEYGERNYFLGG